MMNRRGQDSVILWCRELCQQLMAYMYTKVKSERLLFLRHNQQKLRAEEYIHLRDAIMSNADTAEIGNSIILSWAYLGSPRHMQKNICAIADDPVYLSRLQWQDITYLLLPGENAKQRFDITARVAKQKLNEDYLMHTFWFG